MSVSQQGLSRQVLAGVAWSAMHTLQHGYHITALNGIQGAIMCSGRENRYTSPERRTFDSIPACLDVTLYEFGVVSSTFLLGGLFTSLGASHIADTYGRRAALQISSGLVLLGSVVLSIAPDLKWAVLSRLCIGGGCGVATTITPLFLSEIAPPAYKNRLGIANQSFIVMGVLLTQSLAIPLSKPFVWRLVPMISATMSLLLLAASPFVAESHVWLQHQARKDGRDSDTRESDPLLTNDEAPLVKPRHTMLSAWELLNTTQPTLRRALYTVLLVQLAQQVCGISPVMYYSTQIMSTVFPTSSKTIALMIAAVKVPVTFASALLLKRYKPKQLLVVSAGAMSISAFCLAISMNNGWAIPSSISIIAFVLGFSIGLGPVTWVVIGDVMPSEAASAAGSLGLALNWSTNFIVGMLFLPVRDAMARLPLGGIGNIFFCFAATCLVSCFVVRRSYTVAKQDRPASA